MKRIFLFIFMIGAISLSATDCPTIAEGSFTGWNQKRLELLSFFLPTNPVILQVGGPYGKKSIQFAKHWPESKILSCEALDENCTDSIDFMCLNLQKIELEVLKKNSRILKNVKCISANISSSPSELKNILESFGFQLLTHWDGEVIFVKRNYFLDDASQEFINTQKVDERYQKYYEPIFKIYYNLDDDPEDSIKTCIKQGNPYEGNIGLLIDRLTRPGSIALDVGSHIGIHTITMSRKVGPEGCVVVFEPNKKFYMELLDTLKLNECNNVLPLCKALSDSADQALLSTDFHHCPQVINAKDCLNLAYGSEEPYSGDLVEMITLDSLNLNNLSLIKIDVENYEYFVLKGAKETILRNKPIIIFECWMGVKGDAKEKSNFDRVMGLLKSYGYEIRVIFNCDFIALPAESELANCPYSFKKLDVRF